MEAMAREGHSGSVTSFGEDGGAAVHALLLPEPSKLPLVSVQEYNHM